MDREQIKLRSLTILESLFDGQAIEFEGYRWGMPEEGDYVGIIVEQGGNEYVMGADCFTLPLLFRMAKELPEEKITLLRANRALNSVVRGNRKERHSSPQSTIDNG